MGAFAWLFRWFRDLLGPSELEYSAALDGMRLGPPGSSQNALMIQFFTWECKHPTLSWWKHFETEVPRLAQLGVTQVWLPPPHKAMDRNGAGYDAYDLWDLGEFDQKGTIATRWGRKHELLQAIATANAHGIDVLIDAVLNHKLGADRPETFRAVPVDVHNRLREVAPAREIEAWTAFDFPGRNGQYSSMKWTHDHFSGVDWDQRARLKGIYRIVGGRHQGWSPWVDNELGNYDYLLGADIDHRHPEVRNDLLSWGTWVLQTTGATGFRIDAIKHYDRTFLLEFIKNARQTTNRQDLFAVAEYWSGNIKLFKPYIRAFEGLVAFFDAPLHYNFHEASKLGPRYDLRRIFDNTVLGLRPGDAVTFVDNHDTQVGQSLQSWIGPAFKLQAYALILLRGEGHPCVFYGDLYPNKECYDAYVARGLERLLAVRKTHAYGVRVDYPVDAHCVGFVRMGDGAHPGCAVVISNAQNHGADSKEGVHRVRMNVGVHNGNAAYCALMEPAARIDVGPDGWGVFTCAPGHIQVWVREEHVRQT
ncbi:alpha amylase [Amylocystis lapponica]|nr:alpha amylase [Amylocystis lapponica]